MRTGGRDPRTRTCSTTSPSSQGSFHEPAAACTEFPRRTTYLHRGYLDASDVSFRFIPKLNVLIANVQVAYRWNNTQEQQPWSNTVQMTQHQTTWESQAIGRLTTHDEQWTLFDLISELTAERGASSRQRDRFALGLHRCTYRTGVRFQLRWVATTRM